jgi:hypothetical protein
MRCRNSIAELFAQSPDPPPDSVVCSSYSAHQPYTIGYLQAWSSGGAEWNWSPGHVGHSVFSESDVWAARIQTERGPVVRVYEYDRLNHTTWQGECASPRNDHATWHIHLALACLDTTWRSLGSGYDVGWGRALGTPESDQPELTRYPWVLVDLCCDAHYPEDPSADSGGHVGIPVHTLAVRRVDEQECHVRSPHRCHPNATPTLMFAWRCCVWQV